MIDGRNCKRLDWKEWNERKSIDVDRERRVIIKERGKYFGHDIYRTAMSRSIVNLFLGSKNHSSIHNKPLPAC